MGERTLTLAYPEDLEEALHLPSDQLAAEIRLMAALKLFELGRISSGKAAELAGMSRLDFLDLCGRYRISIYNPDSEDIEAELLADLEVARQAHR